MHCWADPWDSCDRQVRMRVPCGIATALCNMQLTMRMCTSCACAYARRQPLVPVVSVEDGQWLLCHKGLLMVKPGGHGAIWKLMRDEGVFAWLQQQVRQARAGV